MNDGPIERLPSHVLELLALEKDAYPDDPRARDAVFARVENAVILSAPLVDSAGHAGRVVKAGAGATAASAARGGLVAKLVAVGIAAFAAGGITGASVVRAVDARPTSTSTPVVATRPAAPSLPVSSAPAPPVVRIDDLPKVVAAHPVPAASTGATNERSASAASDLSRERELLDVARAALGRGSPDGAIDAARKHEQRWPHGALAEEREVILIQALVAAGRTGAAEERAAQFRSTFPRSMFAPAVAAALEPPSAATDAPRR